MRITMGYGYDSVTSKTCLMQFLQPSCERCANIRNVGASMVSNSYSMMKSGWRTVFKKLFFLLSTIFLYNRDFYVQPEPVNGSTRPSSTIFGYTSPHSTGPIIMPRLRPPSVHTLRTPESSASEEEDRADLLGRNFQVPRPKSRSSIAVRINLH